MTLMRQRTPIENKQYSRTHHTDTHAHTQSVDPPDSDLGCFNVIICFLYITATLLNFDCLQNLYCMSLLFPYRPSLVNFIFTFKHLNVNVSFGPPFLPLYYYRLISE